MKQPKKPKKIPVPLWYAAKQYKIQERTGRKIKQKRRGY